MYYNAPEEKQELKITKLLWIKITLHLSKRCVIKEMSLLFLQNYQESYLFFDKNNHLYKLIRK